MVVKKFTFTISSADELFAFLSHRVDRALTDDVMTVIQQRYTLSQNEQNSFLTIHSFVLCCCHIVCMLGNCSLFPLKTLKLKLSLQYCTENVPLILYLT